MGLSAAPIAPARPPVSGASANPRPSPPVSEIQPEVVADAAQNWDGIYRDNVRSMHRFLYGKTGNRPDAEDLTSQVFARALPRLQARTPGEVRAYLFATARTVLTDHWRERRGLVLGLSPEELESPVRVPESDCPETRVVRILGLLPEKHRRILELRFLRGLSGRETAEEMGITVTNAKVMQLRALRKAAELGLGPCR